MIMEVTLEPAGAGTNVMFLFKNIPPAIRPEDNEAVLNQHRISWSGMLREGIMQDVMKTTCRKTARYFLLKAGLQGEQLFTKFNK